MFNYLLVQHMSLNADSARYVLAGNILDVLSSVEANGTQVLIA